jgi:hypothetical protein
MPDYILPVFLLAIEGSVDLGELKNFIANLQFHFRISPGYIYSLTPVHAKVLAHRPALHPGKQ